MKYVSMERSEIMKRLSLDLDGFNQLVLIKKWDKYADIGGSGEPWFTIPRNSLSKNYENLLFEDK